MKVIAEHKLVRYAVLDASGSQAWASLSWTERAERKMATFAKGVRVQAVHPVRSF